MNLLLLHLLLVFSSLVSAKRSLKANALVTCMENSQLSANHFDVVFNPDDSSLHYTLDFDSQIDDYIGAKIVVYAYGFPVITKNIDLCSIGWKQFCPLQPGKVQIESIEFISKQYTNMIPGIAYQVPDIDAFARVTVFNANNTQLACIQAYFDNGKTVEQTGVKWVSAAIAGIGLLTSAMLSTFGNSNAASHISAMAMSLFLYFQSVVVVSMSHVDVVPPIAAAWSENLIWSMGLIRVTFMQKIFRWYIESTGGKASLNLTSTTLSVLTQRSLDMLDQYPLVKRVSSATIEKLMGNSNTLIFRGIKRLAYRVDIENTAIVVTGFTFFVLLGYVLMVLLFLIKTVLQLQGRDAGQQDWTPIMKGSLLRYIYIGFTQLTIFSLYEFTQVDSPAVVVLAVLLLLLAVGILGWSSYRTISFARMSINLHENPAAILYGDETVLAKYGWFYTMFNANCYYWNLVILTQIFVKALFIGLAQGSGKTQALALFIIDLVYLIFLCRTQPYLDKATNIVNITMSAVSVVNDFLFLFFSNLFGQPAAVGSIMGWVFFILNAAFSLILLIMVLVYCSMVAFSKNPDLRFKPTKDDRTSFQKKNQSKPTGVTNELAALGITAKDHNDNWEESLTVQQKDMAMDTSGSSEDDLTFSDKVKRALSVKSRNKSLKSPDKKFAHTKNASVSGHGLIEHEDDFDFGTGPELHLTEPHGNRHTSQHSGNLEAMPTDVLSSNFYGNRL